MNKTNTIILKNKPQNYGFRSLVSFVFSVIISLTTLVFMYGILPVILIVVFSVDISDFEKKPYSLIITLFYIIYFALTFLSASVTGSLSLKALAENRGRVFGSITIFLLVFYFLFNIILILNIIGKTGPNINFNYEF